MNRVEVARRMVGMFAMQVCAVKDATDEEILKVCNMENPAGTSNGWGRVVREIEDGSLLVEEQSLPVQCEDYEDRTHFLIFC